MTDAPAIEAHLGARAFAAAVLTSASPVEKTAAVGALRAMWARSRDLGDEPCLPDHPARPLRPTLLAPNRMRRRSAGSEDGRAALLHAVAHIELNAIDLAADMVARFAASDDIPGEAREAFVSDWIGVCSDEARHFALLESRLATLNRQYGDYPAHDGLWQAAEKTKHDLAARIAVVPMALEARGLDVTPGMIDKLERAGDLQSADVLRIILSEEIAHVAAGWRWFSIVCSSRGMDPAGAFRALIDQHFPSGLKGPFNTEARTRAGLLPHLYGGGSGSEARNAGNA